MGINKETMDLIKEFEGLRLKTYRDQAGVLTIGYGTTSRAGIGVNVRQGMVITEDQAEVWLREEVEKTAARVADLVKRRINSNQFGAFVSLAYNIGTGAFARSSALRHFNAGDNAKAAQAILAWNKVTDPKTGKKVISNGLKRRRLAERALFLKPVVAPVLGNSRQASDAESQHQFPEDGSRPLPKPLAPSPSPAVEDQPGAPSPSAKKRAGLVAIIAALGAGIGAWLLGFACSVPWLAELLSVGCGG